ncbi:hypothetical protein JCM3770_002887 [Rhodotorula araucariae]
MAENGVPLPFIYNPLLERFLKSPEALASGHAYGYGYEVQLGDEEVEGLPQHVNLETICSLDYLRFSSGVSQAYAVVNRLDRLMVCSHSISQSLTSANQPHAQFVAKSLVGETYLLYGLDPQKGHTRHMRDEEAQGLLDEHIHGPDSRRTSFDRTSTM